MSKKPSRSAATDSAAVATLHDFSASKSKADDALPANLAKAGSHESSKEKTPASLKAGGSPFKQGFSRWYKNFKELSQKADEAHASMMK